MYVILCRNCCDDFRSAESFPLSELKLNIGDNWLLGTSNIRVLVKRIEQYYTEVIGQSSGLNELDASSIARDKDIEGLLMLAEAVLECTINSEMKECVVHGIMAMDGEVQAALIPLLQKVFY